jgi:3-deoxy-D-manno-octulosonic acid kinase
VGSTLLITREEFFAFMRDALHERDTLYAFAALRPDAIALQGRGSAYRIASPHGDLVVRRYRRGGAVASMLGDRYLRVGEARPLRELRVSAAARERGVRTPEVRAAVLHQDSWFVRGDLATEYIDRTEDLAQLGFGQSIANQGEMAAAWTAAGRLVRELASAGLSHPDLNLKNILIRYTANGPQAWVIDLDRCRMGRADAGAMWRRLLRSLGKWERTTARSLSVGMRDALEAGYKSPEERK